MYFVKKHTTHFGILFCHSCTSAVIERVFSITNALWTEEKHSFLVENIKAMLVKKQILRNFCAKTSVL
jgi:hypothetical protein